MNDFKILRQRRQKDFDINTKELIDFEFNGIKKKVYGNCNFSIFVDDYCNADCKFCVAQLRYENQKQAYCKPKIEDDDEYFKRLEEVLAYIKPLNVSVSITGGEPTHSNRLIRILELINKYDMRKRTITTNGSGLLEIVDGKSILEHLIINKFSHLNISKTHYNEQINREIMSYKKGYCSNEMLEKIVPYALQNNLRPRMSCLLLKEGISTIDDIHEYIKFYQKIGVDNVIFRELMDYNKNNMKNTSKMDYCTKNKVKLNDIWKQIDNDKKFVPFKNILGYYYYVEIYNYENVTVCSESANLVKLYEEKAKNNDIVYELIFHPNGNLNGSWVDNEEILLKK